MAKKRSGEKSRQRKTATGVRGLFLLAAGLSGAALFILRCEIDAGVRAYGMAAGREVIESTADLPALSRACPRPAEVVGIPDYANVFRAEPRGGGREVACFRILSFENRLIACSPHGLTQPRDIEEIIQKKGFSGSLDRLDRCPFEASVKRGFREKTGETLPRDAFLLEVGKVPVPSVHRFVLLVLLVPVCFFSAYRAIKR